MKRTVKKARGKRQAARGQNPGRQVRGRRSALRDDPVADQFVDVIAHLPNVDVCNDTPSLLRNLRIARDRLVIEVKYPPARKRAHDTAIRIAAYAIRLAQTLASCLLPSWDDYGPRSSNSALSTQPTHVGGQHSARV
jgi:hypothetical protein